jgi:hypothetical protein
MKHVLALVSFILWNISLQAQSILLAPDSVSLNKKMFGKTYKPADSELSAAKITTSSPRQEISYTNNKGENLIEGAITLLTGITTSSGEKMLLSTKNELRTTGNTLSWQVPLYFTGEYEKIRERIKNDDGSVSVHTTKGYYVNWGEGAFGFILENNDTIGEFYVSTAPETDSGLMNWVGRIEDESRWVSYKLARYGQNTLTQNYTLKGLLHGKEFIALHSGKNYRSLILADKTPVMIFQSEPDFIILNRKNRITPYMLTNSDSIFNRKDLFRLAMLDRIISSTLSKDYFEK